jgi:hypothetical protein
MLPSQNDGFKSREILFVTNDLREEMYKNQHMTIF